MRFPPVCVDHLRHAYGKHKVYEDLSLSFEMGKIYGLLGKNGVGKTTLIKIIMGFLKPLGGSCRIFAHPAHAIRPATRERVGLLSSPLPRSNALWRLFIPAGKRNVIMPLWMSWACPPRIASPI